MNKRIRWGVSWADLLKAEHTSEMIFGPGSGAGVGNQNLWTTKQAYYLADKEVSSCRETGFTTVTSGPEKAKT
jgi:hypothetical protein